MGFDVHRSCEQTDANLAAHLRVRPLSLTERDDDSNQSISVGGFAAMSLWRATLGANRFELAISDHANQPDICRRGEDLCFDMRVVNELLENDTLSVATTISSWDWTGRNSSGPTDTSVFSAVYQLSTASIVGAQIRVREIARTPTELQLIAQVDAAAYELRFRTPPSDARNSGGQWSWQASSTAATAQFDVRQPAFVAATWTFTVRAMSRAESDTMGDMPPPIVASLTNDQLIWIGGACGGALLLIVAIIVAVVVAAKRRRRSHTHG